MRLIIVVDHRNTFKNIITHDQINFSIRDIFNLIKMITILQIFPHLNIIIGKLFFLIYFKDINLDTFYHKLLSFYFKLKKFEDIYFFKTGIKLN